MNFRLSSTYRKQLTVRMSKYWLPYSIIVCVGFISGFFVIRKLLKAPFQQPILVEYHVTATNLKDPLKSTVNVVCWVLTSPPFHLTRAQHVKNTWARNCNTLLFMSSANDTLLGTVPLPVSEGREHLWKKTKESLTYLYSHHLSADWYLKADDDTYVILSNLRLLLDNYNATQPWFLGLRFEPKNLPVFASGGAGYVLSRGALKKVVEKGLSDADKCRQDDGGFEDVELAKCLGRLGISVADTRDKNGGLRFMPYMPNIHADEEKMQGEKMLWFEEFTRKAPVRKGMAGLSSSAITFHYVKPEEMYELDFLINHLRPYGYHR